MVLGGGVTLHGRVSGVEFRDLAAVVVRTVGPGGSRVTGVGPEGRFVLPNLPTGEVQLTVELTGSGAP